MISKIEKRSGKFADFKIEKIEDAVYKALTFTKEGGKEEAREISKKVLNLLLTRFGRDETPHVEDVQNIVEEVLILDGFTETSKAYILYREKRREMRDTLAGLDESTELIEKYIDEIDWQVKENANMTYSLQGLNQYTTSYISKKYWLNKIYPEKIRNAANNQDFHIHDLNLLATYCCGWDLQDLLIRGFGGVSSKVESKPPKHLRPALGQIVNFFFTLQGESAGAQAMSNFDTLLAPFIRKDNLSYKQVKQSLQEFAFNCMVPTRVGFQTPFINVSLDVTVPQFMKDQQIIIGGEPQEETYGDFQKEMDIFNKAFYEVLMEGDAKGRVFTFPIPTISITKDFDWDNERLDKMWEATAKYGINYFSNFIHSDMNPEDFRSMCLHSEEDIFIKKDGEVLKTTIGELFDIYKGERIDKEWFKTKELIEAMSLNPETGKMEWSEIDKFLEVTEKEMVSIETMDGKTMNVSKDHLVAVFSEEGIKTKKAQEITENDFLLSLKDGSGLLNEEDQFLLEKGSVGKDFHNREETDLSFADGWDLSNEKIENLRKSEFAVVAVKSIRKEELETEQSFYDIELKKNHYFVHSDGNITHNCCRLRLDNNELIKRGGGLFGSQPLTGSIGVVTINLPRIGYLSKTKEQFFNRLEEMMDLAKESLELKRKVLDNFIEKGLYPYTRHYLSSVKEIRGSYFGNHFSTIGFIGMNESLLNFMKENIASDKGREFALEVLDFMNKKLIEYQEETDSLYNLEATPGEGASFRQARIDREKYPDIVTAGTKEAPYYTNSVHLPVNYTDDPFEALDMQDELQTKFTGGTVLHLFLGERMPDAHAAKSLVRKVFENYSLPYITLSPTFSICPNCGYIKGERLYCPNCKINKPKKVIKK